MRLLEKLLGAKPKRYGWIAIAALILMNIMTYYGSRLFTSSAQFYDLSTPLDSMIPFLPPFILIYSVVAYTQWVVGYYYFRSGNIGKGAVHDHFPAPSDHHDKA